MSFNQQRLLLKTPFNPSTGYGRDGILLAGELDKTGADLHLEPKYVGLPLPQNILPLFCKPRPTHFEVAINHEYPGELAFPEGMHEHADKLVAWTMYEFTSFGEDNEMTEKLRERLDNFDLVLVYDDISYQSLLEYMNNPEKLKILQGGYDSDFWKPSDEELASRDWDGPFRFCMNGAMNVRKNPWGTIWAFQQLKEEYGDKFDAELHMKTTSMIFHPSMEEWCPGLRIHYANWSAQDLKRFYLKMNCLFAPSWGEGKNLPALEAQTTGCPVAVSAVGGHMQWADPEWSYLMHGPMEDHKPGMFSMRVSVDTIKETMWHVYNNREEAKLRGKKAAQVIPRQCDWQPVVEKLQYLVDAL